MKQEKMMRIKYKKSQFNYLTKTKTGYILYNTLYNSLSRLSESEYKQYENLKFDTYDLEKDFVKQGFIVDKEIDELQRYNVFSELSSRYIQSAPCITLTPTMACNARCFYCYEEGVREGNLQEEDIENIIWTIKKFNLNKGLKLTWFGGEPLLNQSWMDAFSTRLKEEGILFSAFIITNGSKIDDDVIKKMVSLWNVENVQITFDGSAEEYLKRKSYYDYDERVYYQILKSIGKLDKAGIGVHIRLNTDSQNKESILEAARDITQLYKDSVGISYYPAFLTGTKQIMPEGEKIEFIKKLIEIGNNFNINEYLYKVPRTAACYHYQENAISIDSQGNIFTCEHLLGHGDRAIGNIKDEIVTGIKKRDISGKREECQKCVFLPKCQGGCWDAYLAGDDPCFIDKYVIKAYLELL